MEDRDLRRHFVELRQRYDTAMFVISAVFILFSLTIIYDIGDAMEVVEDCPPELPPELGEVCDEIEERVFVTIIQFIIFFFGGICIYFMRASEPKDQ